MPDDDKPDDKSKKNNVIRLPGPESITPPVMRNSLLAAVRPYFYKLYNESQTFKNYILTCSHEDAVTKNRHVDLYKAAEMIKKLAEDAGDQRVAMAYDGEIMQCIKDLKEKDPLLKGRYAKYRLLKQTPPEAAE